MNRNHDEHRRQVPQAVGKIIGIVMVVLYIASGTTILFRASSFPDIPEQTAKFLGIMLLVYGCFRAYKVYRRHFSSANETDTL